MAEKMEVKLYRYVRWERGKDDEETLPDLPNITDLQEHEICFILRRRAGLRQADLVGRIGKCRWWINQMEQGLGDPAELLDFWAQEADDEW